jgi:hypothetical protein
MNSKTLNYSILILLLIGFLGQLFIFFNILPSIFWISFGSTIGQIAGLIILILSGKTRRDTFYFTLISIFTGIILISMVFKIIHLPGADIVLIIGSFGILLSYLFHFLTFKGKKVLDFLKLMWAFIFILSFNFIILHIPFGHFLKQIEIILFIIIFYMYMSQHNEIK